MVPVSSRVHGDLQEYPWSKKPNCQQDVRFWKDRLLYQIRRFRQIVGRSLEKGQKAFDEVPDAVERDRRTCRGFWGAVGELFGRLAGLKCKASMIL